MFFKILPVVLLLILAGCAINQKSYKPVFLIGGGRECYEVQIINKSRFTCYIKDRLGNKIYFIGNILDLEEK